MKPPLLRGQTSNIAVVFIPDTTSTTGAGKTGLTNASAGLLIACRREKSPTATVYSGANIVSITTLGTYASPGAGKIGFKEIDATNQPGMYELQFDDALLNTSDTSRMITGMVQVTGGAPSPFEIALWSIDPQDGVRAAMTSLPNATAGTSGGLPVLDASLRVLANLGAILNTTLTETVPGYLAAAFKKLLDVATPVFTAASVNQTGDSFGLIGATGSGLTSLAPASTALSNATWTNARAGYLDNLNVGGAVASHADILAINQSASKHLLLVTSQQFEPGETYTVECRTFKATDGSSVNADTTPSLTATGIVSGNLDANIGVASNPATGVYRWTYTPGTSPTLEQIRFDVSATISAATFTLSAYAQTVDEAMVVFTLTDQAHLTAIYNKLPTNGIADESVLLAAIGTPMQAGTVTVSGFSAGAITAASIAAGALNGKGDWPSAATIAASILVTPSNLLATGAGGVVSHVALVDTTTAVTNAVAVTSNLKKNQALNNFRFVMTDSTNHNPTPGLTVTVTRGIDGGAQAAGTLSAVTDLGNGEYSVNFGAADMNGNVITLEASAAGADTVIERLITQP